MVKILTKAVLSGALMQVKFKLKTANNRIQLTVKSVMFFAKQKNTPLFTSADAGVSAQNAGTYFVSYINGGVWLPNYIARHVVDLMRLV